MPHIVVADPLGAEVIRALETIGTVQSQPTNLLKALAAAEVLIVRSVTKVTAELLSHAPHLRIVARAGVGIDNIDAAACAERSIQVINTPNVSTNSVAELTIAFVFNLLRHLPQAHHLMKDGVWAKKDFIGMEVEGKTLGLIGLGRIGSKVAEKALALGLKVNAYNPTPKEVTGVTLVPFDELLATSDIISLHATLTDQTHRLINADTIAQMKPGAYLINVARGDLIDEDALYEACQSRHLAGAACDVFSREPYTGKLTELDNVILTPHLGASTAEAQLRIGTELVSRLKAALADEATPG